MPVFQPIQTAFNKLFSRFGRAGYRGDIREIYGGLLPVVQVARDHTDTARPLWGIAAGSGNAVGEFPSCSITSARDISIERLDWYVSDAVGIAVANFISLYTPPASYVPFAIAPTTFAAVVRPKLTFDLGLTRAIGGRNAALNPLGGMGVNNQVERNFEQLGGAACVNCGGALNFPVPLTTETKQFKPQPFFFEDPLILPAGMFFTVQSTQVGADLLVSFWYREL